MSVVSSKTKGQATYPQFGCSLRHSRGASACANRNTISDLGLNAAVMTALRAHLASPQVEEWLNEYTAAAERAHARARQDQDEKARLESEAASTQAKLNKVADAIATIGHSDTLAQRLRSEEEKVQGLREQLARLAPQAPRKPAIRISAGRVLHLLKDIEKVVAARPAQARVALAAVVESVVLLPVDGRLRATMTLKNKTASIAGGRLDSDGCGAGLWRTDHLVVGGGRSAGAPALLHRPGPPAGPAGLAPAPSPGPRRLSSYRLRWTWTSSGSFSATFCQV